MPAAGSEPVQPVHLDDAQGRADVRVVQVQAELGENVTRVVAGDLMGAVRPAPVPDPPHLLVGVLVVGEDEAAFPGADVMRAVGGCRGGQPGIAGVNSPLRGPERLADVLDQRQAVLLADLQRLVHVRRVARHVDERHGIDLAAPGHLPEPVRVHVQACHRCPTRTGTCRHHFLAALYSVGNCRAGIAIRAPSGSRVSASSRAEDPELTNRARRPALPGCRLLLELGDLPAGRPLLAAQDLGYRVDLFLARDDPAVADQGLVLSQGVT